MQGDKIIRLAKHAGSWYSNNNHQEIKLDQQLDGYLSKVQKDIKKEPLLVKALIGPHAGYRYSGPVAAWSYNYFYQHKSQKLRIFLLGPSHHKHLKGVSLSICSQLETPFGNIQVDIETVQKLKSQISNVVLTRRDEEKEHSLQMHLPYIKKIFGDNIKIVPIIVGVVSEKMAEDYGRAFAPYLDSDDTIFIVSSDFCHWGDNFDYHPYDEKKGQIWESIKSMDEEGMKLIEGHNLKDFSKYIESTGNTICGEYPIKVLLGTLQQSKYKHITKFVRYDQSQKVTSTDQNSVSYATSVSYRQ